MTEGTFSVTIQAPPEKVWPWVADLGKHAQWSPKPYRMEWIEGEPNAVGSRYRSVGAIPGDKNHTNEGRITHNQPFTRFEFMAEDGGDVANSFTLTPGGDATEVVFTLKFPKMKGKNAVLLPIAFPLVGKPDLRKRLQLLKEKVENSG